MLKIKTIFEMFFCFLKIGSFTFGGGYAMIPLIEKEFVEKKKWIDKEEFINILALSQSFPGALAANTATFVGYKISGVLGAVIALLGTIFPAFIVVLIIAMFLANIRDNYYVNLAFKGINASVPALILVGVFSLFKSVKKSYINFIFVILTIVLITIFNISPIFIIIASGAFGYFYYKERC